MSGQAADDYSAPLCLAWQLTNRCSARCLACCEESGPTAQWQDELSRDEAVALVDAIIGQRIPYVAFGGGEPLGVAHCWELFERLHTNGVALKIETDGSRIDDEAANRLAALAVECVQISVDGATAVTHQRVRPGTSFDATISAIRRLTSRGLEPQLVFVPNRLNLHEMIATYDLAERLGCSAFVTGPMMRIGRAAAAWDSLSCTDAQWQRAVDLLTQHASDTGGKIALSIYPFDILAELDRGLRSPQALLLVVPNGRVKILNALPFAAADLRRNSLDEAWRAYCLAWRTPEVRQFIEACHLNPNLLSHANEVWPVPTSSVNSAHGSQRTTALRDNNVALVRTQRS
jgi:MoaA/NifB/PqqE/SkfB family radical SAM enzyme